MKKQRKLKEIIGATVIIMLFAVIVAMVVTDNNEEKQCPVSQEIVDTYLINCQSVVLEDGYPYTICTQNLEKINNFKPNKG